MSNRTVSVVLRAEVSDLVSKMGTAARSTKQLGDDLKKLGDDAPQKLDKITTAAAAVGVGMVAMAGVAVKSFMDFDKQMSEVGAVTDATAAQIGQLKNAALEAGKATQYSATEAAKAEAELAKAGLSTADILGGALTGSLALAAAGQIDLSEAAEVSAKTMTVFELHGKDVGHVADVLAAAANKSATDVHQMGESLKMGGLAAHAAGLSLEETSGVLALFASNTLVGSDAGTSLKTSLMMLQNPTKKSSELMRELGIDVYDAQGNFVGMEKLAGILQDRLGGLTQEQRNAALATIFGADGMRAANILYKAGAAGVAEYTRAVDDQGAAADVAAKKTDNLAGDVERLQGSLETMFIGAGSGANDGMRSLVQMANSVVDAVSNIPAPIQTAGVVTAGLGGSALLAAAGYLKMRTSVREALDALSATGAVGEKAAKGLSTAAGAAGRLGVAFAVLQTASALMDSDTTGLLSGLTKDLTAWGKTGKEAGEVTRMFGKDLENLHYDLATIDTGAWTDFTNGFAGLMEGIGGEGPGDLSLGKAKARFSELDTALATMANGGHMDDAKTAFERLRVEADKQGISVDELKKALPQWAAAMDGATASEQTAVSATEKQEQSARLLNATLKDSIDTLGSFSAAWEQFNGSAVDMSQKTIQVEDALDKMRETAAKGKLALDGTGTSFDVTTEAGRKAQEQLLSCAKAAAEMAQAVYEQTGDVDQAAAMFDKYKNQLIDTLQSMGLTRDQAIALADSYMRIPATVVTRVQLYGTDDANQQIQAIKDSLARLPNTKTITITTKAQLPSGLSMGALMRADGGTVDFYADGGVRDVNRVAQIAQAGTWRVWAEPETGGEAYIPFATSKRARSTAVLAEANRRLGSPMVPKASRNAGPYASVINAGGNRPTAGAGAVQVVEHRHVVEIEGTGLLNGLRREIRIQGGNAQQVLGRGGQ